MHKNSKKELSIVPKCTIEGLKWAKIRKKVLTKK